MFGWGWGLVVGLGVVVGVRYAQPFYDDLLITSPTIDSPGAILRSYLGMYPHPDTILMGITPKRAS